MKIDADNVRGFRDILPPESLKRDAVKRVIEKNFRIYGFVPIETPVVELDEVMKSDSLYEDEAAASRFKFRDRAGRNLGLRYEFTFQLARILKQNNLKLPFRRYQIGDVFRDEPIGPGKFRQFTQCDADILGDSLVDAEAECLYVVFDILKDLKIKDYELQINNRKLLHSIIESVEIREKNAVMRVLGDLEKFGEDNIKLNLKKYADSNQIITLFKLLEKDLAFFEQNAFEGVAELKSLFDKCKRFGLNVKFAPSLVRGFDYYTGNVFEFKQGKQSFAAGGRYDKLLGRFMDKSIPAVGVSIGLERICDLANISVEPYLKSLVVSLGSDGEANKLVRMLRKEGISSLCSFDKVEDAEEYAKANLIPHLVLVEKGESGKYKVKNVWTSEEKLLSEKQLIKLLR